MGGGNGTCCLDGELEDTCSASYSCCLPGSQCSIGSQDDYECCASRTPLGPIRNLDPASARSTLACRCESRADMCIAPLTALMRSRPFVQIHGSGHV